MIDCGLDAEDGKGLAGGIGVHGSLSAIDVGFNPIGQSSARLILEAMKGKDMQSIGMDECDLGAGEVKILADYMRVMASLTEVRSAAPVACDRAGSQLFISCTGGPPLQQARRGGLVRHL